MIVILESILHVIKIFPLIRHDLSDQDKVAHLTQIILIIQIRVFHDIYNYDQKWCSGIINKYIATYALYSVSLNMYNKFARFTI